MERGSHGGGAGTTAVEEEEEEDEVFTFERGAVSDVLRCLGGAAFVAGGAIAAEGRAGTAAVAALDTAASCALEGGADGSILCSSCRR